MKARRPSRGTRPGRNGVSVDWEAALPLMGTMTDAQLGKRLGVAGSSVARERNARRISAYGLRLEGPRVRRIPSANRNKPLLSVAVSCLNVGAGDFVVVTSSPDRIVIERVADAQLEQPVFDLDAARTRDGCGLYPAADVE